MLAVLQSLEARWLEFGLLAFTSLFTMINPLGIIPVYTTLTTNLSGKQAHRVALKAVLTALIILVLFALTGKFIFDFFSISVNSLKIVGGVIFFMTGYDMLQARLSRTKDDGESHADYASDIAITPLAIPITCGPGAITMVIILMKESVQIEQKILLFSAIFAVLLVTYLLLLSARRVIQFLGESGNKVMLRIMGLIVMVISVEFFFAGLKPILRDILMIHP
ncbi:MAG: MarC family protein [Gemmatimonadetes bacterium]|nr:MAG: MarC family protein [Gemmatimonadota bacterium]